MAATHRLADEEWQRTKQALDNNKWNVAQAARDLGIARQTVQSRIISARARQMAPEGLPLDGFHVKGVSTLYDAQGEVKATWVKSQADAEQQEQAFRATLDEFLSAVKPAKAEPPPKHTTSDLCVAYCIGDAHLGLYSWGAETGADFDLTIAMQDLRAAVDRLVSAAPPADEAIIVQLGDFYHINDSKNETPQNGNKLDVDSRFPKVIRAGINTMRYMIDRALEKHKIVRVRNAAGNHDPTASITLTEALIGYYSKEPRVIVEDSPKSFYIFRFGSNLVGITHGHTAKPDKLPGVLAVDGHSQWSECEFRYVWHGHIHNKKVFEEMGVIVESFRTLAAKDAWHAEAGYRAGREMQAIVLHKDFGEVERHTAGIKHLRAGA